MKKRNTHKNKYDCTPFFTSKFGYDEFVETMMMAADNDDLPISFQVKQPETLTMDDFRRFSQRFKQDSGLNIEFNLSTCDHCDRLHCIVIVDELPEWRMERDCS